ncbi:MAG: putative transrane protein [Polaromonas sp.]|nr:putative transrane protein [Polaromonas sp.]
MKRRRLLLTAPLWLALGSSACSALPNQRGGQPSYTVSAEQLQQAVARRFPLRYPVGGLIDLNVQAPRLRLLPALNRLGAELAVQAAGPALRRSYSGAFDLDFGLRYEASDQTLRAHQLRVNALRFPDLPPGPAELLGSYGPALAEQALQDVVLHQLQPQDLALPEAMGLQPGSITVTPKGLVIGFVNKPRP